MITSESAFTTGQLFPPEGELSRLKDYENNTNLFEGKHDKVFDLDTKRIRPELAELGRFLFNFNKRLTKLWVSLMLGETPKFTVGEKDTAQQQWLDLWIGREAFVSSLKMHRIDVSRYGDGILKLYVENSRVKCAVQPASHWFPIVDPSNVTKTKSHVLAWKVTQNKQEFLRVEIHRPGEIENKAFLLESSTLKKTQYRLEREVTLQSLGVERDRVEQTGLDAPLVFRTSNLLTSTTPYGFDDYQDIDSIIFELEDRVVQLSRILDKHSDPSMYGPDDALWLNPKTLKWEFKRGGYLPLDSKESAIPGYITWDGQITNALEKINLLMRQLYIVSETSEAAFGQLSQGIAESGSALRRLLMAPLAKSADVRQNYDATLPEFFRALLELASQYEGVEKGELTYSAEWKDGLPNDPTEDAQIVASSRPAKVSMSTFEAVKRMHPDWHDEKVEEEVQRIEDDEANALALAPGAGANTFDDPRGGDA